MKFKLLTLVACLLAAAPVFAQTRTTEIGAMSENDSFLGQGSDRYYTNGIFIYYRHALDASKNPALANKVLEFEIGQKIFNAQSGGIPSTEFLDRPFAGYLYAGSSLNLLYKNESNLKLSAKVGIVGPAAGGEPIQNFIHDTFGFYKLTGWPYQIRNDVELNLSADYNKLLARASWADISLASYVNLGTGFTGAGIGPLIRLGNFNQLFHSVSTQSTASTANVAPPLHNHELFFYYKPQANLVGYDATIQGSMFKDHPEAGTREVTLDKEPFIFSNQLGVSYVSSRIVLDIGAVIQTKDTKQMVKSTHQWGSVTLLYRFN
ncbi:lipid A deacylase LpxR family protein [Mucilaginibacter litoreus]|uniref:Lipid A deacylase LpxR family protein n=1 Tax=Mucilaginibacter litoreus TaxID=1048221 RepID=A0ABW3APW3_9SPHI